MCVVFLCNCCECVLHQSILFCLFPCEPRRPLRALSAASLLSAMAAISARWGAARQEDAHEFYAALLDALQREVVAAQVRPLHT
jgi:hypothetical protein